MLNCIFHSWIRSEPRFNPTIHGPSPGSPCFFIDMAGRAYCRLPDTLSATPSTGFASPNFKGKLPVFKGFVPSNLGKLGRGMGMPGCSWYRIMMNYVGPDLLGHTCLGGPFGTFWRSKWCSAYLVLHLLEPPLRSSASQCQNEWASVIFWYSLALYVLFRSAICFLGSVLIFLWRVKCFKLCHQAGQCFWIHTNPLLPEPKNQSSAGRIWSLGSLVHLEFPGICFHCHLVVSLSWKVERAKTARLGSKLNSTVFWRGYIRQGDHKQIYAEIWWDGYKQAVWLWLKMVGPPNFDGWILMNIEHDQFYESIGLAFLSSDHISGDSVSHQV